MSVRRLLAVALVVLGAAGAFADQVGVEGSSVQYDTPIEARVDEQPVKLVLTGTALRKKVFFKVYAVASYVQEGVTVKTPEELVAADCAKQLHLVMERDIAGKEFADAFRSAIRLNYPEPKFEDELNALIEVFKAQEIKQGDQLRLTHVPKVGLTCELVGKAGAEIRDVAFARAVWEIYLGKNNLGDSIKKGLVSRL